MNPHSDPTLEYYDTHAEEFAQRTRDADMSAQYGRFLALIPPGSHILDAGCGSGRDTLAFLERRFRVTAFDGSSALANIARERTGLPVLHRRFAEVDWQEGFDGVWACASLLHLAGPQLEDAVRRLTLTLRIGGTLYASFKKGTEIGIRDGRFFADHDAASLVNLVTALGRLEIVDIWESEDHRRAHVTWINGLFTRTA